MHYLISIFQINLNTQVYGEQSTYSASQGQETTESTMWATFLFDGPTQKQGVEKRQERAVTNIPPKVTIKDWY